MDGRQQSTVIGYGCPDLVKVAEAYGWKAFHITHWTEAEQITAEAYAYEGCVLVEVMLTLGSTVNPKLTVNRPVEDMSPLLDREELKDLMIIDPLP